MDAAEAARRDIVILGSTGSIGTQAADVIRRNPDKFRVAGLAAGGGNPELLAEQAIEFGADVVAVADERAAAGVGLALRAAAERATGAARHGSGPAGANPAGANLAGASPTGANPAGAGLAGAGSAEADAAGGGGGPGSGADRGRRLPKVLAGPDAMTEIDAWP